MRTLLRDRDLSRVPDFDFDRLLRDVRSSGRNDILPNNLLRRVEHYEETRSETSPGLDNVARCSTKPASPVKYLRGGCSYAGFVGFSEATLGATGKLDTGMLSIMQV